MLALDEQAALIGVSELRKETQTLLRFLQTHKVILTKRNKPIAVVVDFDRYNEMERLIELIEDTAVGLIASEREKGTKKESYLTHEEMKRRVGSR